MMEEQQPRLHLRHVCFTVHRHLDPSQRSSFLARRPPKGRASPCPLRAQGSPCNPVRSQEDHTPRSSIFVSSLPLAKPAQCTTRRTLTLVGAYLLERPPHLCRKRCWPAGPAVHVDVDEVPLGGGRTLVVSEQSDLVAHAAVAEPGDAKTVMHGVGKSDRPEEPAPRLDDQPDDPAPLDVERSR